MRLRRETGDFQIVLKAGETEGTYEVNSIRPGLSAEDLIGELVSIVDPDEPGGYFQAVIKAYDNFEIDTTVTLETVDYELNYDSATGNISATEKTATMTTTATTPAGSV